MQGYKLESLIYNHSVSGHKDAMNSMQRFIKRTFDILLSLIGLILLSPLILLFSFLLLFDDGPIIFKQERIGYKGKPFTIYKFRTMKVNAEDGGIPRLECERNRHLTKVGRFLRAHHLDEMPQLWNVLKGDMSFVGPRPERRCFIEQILAVTDDYKYIYQMRPGITSYATIYNGYTDTMEKMLKRLEYDLEYYDKRSIFMDIKIIMTTLFAVASGKKF